MGNTLTKSVYVRYQTDEVVDALEEEKITADVKTTMDAVELCAVNRNNKNT